MSKKLSSVQQKMYNSKFNFMKFQPELTILKTALITRFNKLTLFTYIYKDITMKYKVHFKMPNS